MPVRTYVQLPRRIPSLSDAERTHLDRHIHTDSMSMDGTNPASASLPPPPPFSPLTAPEPGSREGGAEKKKPYHRVAQITSSSPPPPPPSPRHRGRTAATATQYTPHPPTIPYYPYPCPLPLAPPLPEDVYPVQGRGGGRGAGCSAVLLKSRARRGELERRWWWR